MRAPVVVLLVLLSLDGALILVHVLASRLGAGPYDPAWLVGHALRLDAERGLAESVQYLKYLGLGALALGLYGRGKLRAGIVLALFCLLLLLDDAFQLHERIGASLLRGSSVLGLGPSLSAGLGELLSFAVLGLVFAWFLLASWRRARERDIATSIALLVAGLAFFGGLVDLFSGPLVHSTVAVLADLAGGLLYEPAAAIVVTAADPRGAVASLPQLGVGGLALARGAADPLLAAAVSEVRLTHVLTTAVEEGGEMVMTSLLVTYLVRVFLSGQRDR